MLITTAKGARSSRCLISKYDQVKKQHKKNWIAVFEGNSCTWLSMIDLTSSVCLLGWKSEVFDVQNVPVQQFPSKPLDICCG